MLIDRFFEKGKAFLECDAPIMCGAMTWVREHKLVCAMGNAGGFGNGIFDIVGPKPSELQPGFRACYS